jgi:hypothetical protein
MCRCGCPGRGGGWGGVGVVRAPATQRGWRRRRRRAAGRRRRRAPPRQCVDHSARLRAAEPVSVSKFTQPHSAGTHRGHHCVAQDLHQLLVCHAHVAGAEEAQVLGAVVLLDRQQLLGMGFGAAEGRGKRVRQSGMSEGGGCAPLCCHPSPRAPRAPRALRAAPRAPAAHTAVAPPRHSPAPAPHPDRSSTPAGPVRPQKRAPPPPPLPPPPPPAARTER